MKLAIYGDDSEGVLYRLGDDHAVKWVTMMKGQCP
jgi:hypothetical protein